MTPPRSRADRRSFTYEPARGPRRRVRFEPRSDGDWDRFEDEWTGCRWRAVGHEIVSWLVVE